MAKISKEVLDKMFMNPRAPVANIALDKIEDPQIRETLRNLIRTIEAIYAGAAQASNYNMAKLVAQPSQPDVAEGESIVWHDTDAPAGAPLAFILTRVNGQLFRFPTDQISDGTGGGGDPQEPPEPTLPNLLNITPASTQIDEQEQITLTVNLTAAVPALAGNQNISITSTDSNVAIVTPQTLVIAEGQSSGTITVTGVNNGVCSIVASYNGGQVSSVITVNEVVEPTPDPDFDFMHTFETIQHVQTGIRELRIDNYITVGPDNFYRYQIQCADLANSQNRVFQSPPSRHGGSSIVLRTMGNDTGVSGSGANERCDLNPMYPGAQDGEEYWWAHSIFLPPGFIFPQPPASGSLNWHIIVQFHDNAGSPPIPIMIARYRSGLGFPAAPILRIDVNGGNPDVEQARHHVRNREAMTDNSWYDFVHHIRWSQSSNGFLRTWIRKNNESIGRQEINYSGPTKGSGSVNMKPANYHSYVPGAGNNTDVYHDRIIRGTSPAQVSMFQLENVPPF